MQGAPKLFFLKFFFIFFLGGGGAWGAIYPGAMPSCDGPAANRIKEARIQITFNGYVGYSQEKI